jgi:hypothetical protein
MKHTRILIGALALAGAIHAHAQGNLAVGFAAPGQAGFGPMNINGWEFNVTASVDVVALAFYDADQDGLTYEHDVGLYSSAGVLLASATVLPGDPLAGMFRAHAITPLRLDPGTGYCISGTVRTTDPGTLRVSGVTSAPGIQYVRNRYGFNNGAGPTFPSFSLNSTYDAGLFGPNFLIAAAPAPPPQLKVALSATNTVVVSWPAAATGWTLVENTTASSADWVPSARPPVTVGTDSTVVIQLVPPSGALFLRLRKP